MRTVRTREASVLVVGAGEEREFFRDVLCDVAQLSWCESAAAAPESLVTAPVDAVLAVSSDDPTATQELLDRVRREHPGTDFILVADAPAGGVGGRDGVRAIDVLTRPVHPHALRRLVEQTLFRRQLLAENRRLQDILHTIEGCRALAPCLEQGSVFPVALDLLLNTLSRSRGLSIFRRSNTPLGHTAAFRGFSDEQAGRLRHILIEEKPLDLESFCELGVTESGPVHRALAELGLDASPVLCVPLQGGGSDSGVVWILEDGRRFEAGEIDRAELVASYANAALENADRYHLAKERAFIDDVTEVYNARYLLSATENELRRAERYGNALSVLFLDLDRFKLVNDRYGHLVGSQTLRSLSQVLLQCVRQVDILARYGGDEFTILLVDTDHGEALRVAERIRSTVENHVFEAGNEASLRLTISIGVATCPEHGSTRDPLLDGADKAMYRAKSQGRNRVCSADELDS